MGYRKGHEQEWEYNLFHPHGGGKAYSTWDIQIAGDEHYYRGLVFADSADEHMDQNVNWSVARDGWSGPFGRQRGTGHARTVRAAMRAAQALIKELKAKDDRGA